MRRILHEFILFSVCLVAWVAFARWCHSTPSHPSPKPLSTEFLEAYSYPNGFYEPDYTKQQPKNPMLFHFKPCSTFVPRVEDGEMVKVPAGWVREVTRRLNLEARDE